MTPVQEHRKPALASMVASYPDLVDNKSVQLNLALLEYEDRRERGERPAPLSFAARFPACRSRLVKRLLLREEFDKIADLGTSAAAAPMSEISWPEVGDRLLGFTLLGILGDGSFARVYLARETALGDRLVALKVSLEGKDLPDATTEAEILGRLYHPSIVPIHSVQRDALTGFTLVCMPYLGSTTLGDVLDYVYSPPAKAARAWVILAAAAPKKRQHQAGPFPEPSPLLRQGTYVDGVLELGLQLADALAYVHERHIFHRDLKPSNVLVRPDGRPMLLDFNLSADQSGPEQPMGGTLLYMSPEQLRATADSSDPRPCLLDARSDLYSLGVILYELLAGDHPFVPWKSPEKDLGEDGLRSVLSVRQPLGPRPLRALNPLLDEHLAAVIAKCLAPDPRDRYQTAPEFAGALRHCQHPEHRARRWLLRHPRRALLTAAAVLLAAAAVVAAVRLPSPERHLQQGIHALQAGQYEQAAAALSRALAEENSFRGHMARARAYQKLGKFQNALEDFKLADKLQPSGHTKACIAYCFSRLETPEYHKAAAGFYRSAWNLGYRTALIANNRGYSFLMSRRFSDLTAKNYFRDAMKLDPGFQAASYNFFKVELDMVRGGNVQAKLTSDGLTALEKTFATGPADGHMHCDAARFFMILATDSNPRLIDRALYHVKQAISLGIRPAFSKTGNDAAFAQVLRDTPLGQPVSTIPRTHDPFLSIDE